LEPTGYKSTFALDLLAASLAMRLGVDELEWLGRELVKRTEVERRKEVHGEQGEPLGRLHTRGGLGTSEGQRSVGSDG
jgi:hypothetical protein